MDDKTQELHDILIDKGFCLVKRRALDITANTCIYSYIKDDKQPCVALIISNVSDNVAHVYMHVTKEDLVKL